MAARRRVISSSPRRIVILDDRGEAQVDLPPGARVTFGPDVPYERGASPMGEARTYSVRVYRDSTNASLCAAFPRVTAWRDVDIQTQRTVLHQAADDGVEYRAVAVMLGHGEVPREWLIQQRGKHQTAWSVTQTVLDSEIEAVNALRQLVDARAKLARAGGTR